MDDGQLPPGVLWGKLKQDDNGKVLAYLPLVDHCLDVAMVFRRLVDLPAVTRRLTAICGKSLLSAQLDRLAVIALLHDFGKANLGFQDKPFSSKAPRAGHIRETAPLFNEEHLFGRFTEVFAIDELGAWFESPETIQNYLIAALSHHGKPLDFQSLDRNTARNYYNAKTHWWQDGDRRVPFAALAGDQLVES